MANLASAIFDIMRGGGHVAPPGAAIAVPIASIPHEAQGLHVAPVPGAASNHQFIAAAPKNFMLSTGYTGPSATFKK